MESTLALIHICQIGQIVSAVVCVAAIALAVFLFFKFDISMIHAIRTGKAQEMSVKRMKEKSEKTGQLEKKVNLDYTTDSLGPRRKTEEKKKSASGSPGLETTPLQSGSRAAPAQETDVGKSFGIKFNIIEEILVLHTDEVV